MRTTGGDFKQERDYDDRWPCQGAAGEGSRDIMLISTVNV